MKRILLLVCILIIIGQEVIKGDKSVCLLCQLSDYVRSNLKPQRLTLITKSTKALTSTSARLIKAFLGKYPSLLIETKSTRQGSSAEEDLSILNNFLSSRAESYSAKIIFLDLGYDTRVDEELIGLMDFLINSSAKVSRPKCLIFLVNAEAKAIEIERFFRYSWSRGFLDIAAIEIIEKIRYDEALIQVPEQTNITLHEYNPFSDTYYTGVPLAARANLFVDKLENFQKMSVHIGANEYFPNVIFPKEFNYNNIWNELQGCDVLLTNILAEKLNFTVDLRIIFSEDVNVQLLLNSSYSNLAEPLYDHFIDYVVNIDYIMGTQSLDKHNFSIGLSLEQGSFYFIVKQHSNSKFELSENFVVILAIFLILAAITIAFAYLARFNKRVWAAYNVLRILIGTSITNVPEDVPERVFFTFLSFVSLTFTSAFIEQLFRIYIAEKEFLELGSLKSLIDSRIVPSISKYTKKFYASTSNEDFRQILSISKLIDNKYANAGASKCIIQMINDLEDVDGCETDQLLGTAVAQRFSDTSNDWIISLVREPFATGVSITVHSQTSAYVKKFNRMTRSLYDTGIIQYLKDYAIRNYSFDHKEFFQYGYDGSGGLATEEPVENKKIFSASVIFAFFFVSYAISALIFSFEIMLKRLRKH